MLTVSQVAQRVGVSTAAVYGLIERGEVAHVRVLDNAIRIALADLEAYIKARRKG